jgi:hypothetical protein
MTRGTLRWLMREFPDSRLYAIRWWLELERRRREGSWWRRWIRTLRRV